MTTLSRAVTVARLGGDEFSVLLPDAGNDAMLATTAGDILKALAAPLMVEGHELFVSGSIGIARYPHDTADIRRNDDQLFAVQRVEVWARDLRWAKERRDIGNVVLEQRLPDKLRISLDQRIWSIKTRAEGEKTRHRYDQCHTKRSGQSARQATPVHQK